MVTKQESRSIVFLRVVAMLIVMILLHYMPRYSTSGLAHIVGELIGFAGVGTFFAISGFLYGRKAQTAEYLDSYSNVMHWLLRRGKKLFPPYWTVLFIVIGVRLLRGMPVAMVSVVSQFFNLQGIFQLRWAFDELGATWFLSILMACYFLTPSLERLGKQKKTATLVPVGGGYRDYRICAFATAHFSSLYRECADLCRKLLHRQRNMAD